MIPLEVHWQVSKWDYYVQITHIYHFEEILLEHDKLCFLYIYGFYPLAAHEIKQQNKTKRQQQTSSKL